MKCARRRGSWMSRQRQARNAAARPGWHEIGGKRKYYRSRWEANYARYLEWLKCMGQIRDWSHEPKTFWFDGVKRGVVSYLPDFLVIENSGREVYHEVKGWMDARSRTKIRRMRIYHPKIALVVIDRQAYAEIRRKVSRLVPEWQDADDVTEKRSVAVAEKRQARRKSTSAVPRKRTTPHHAGDSKRAAD